MIPKNVDPFVDLSFCHSVIRGLTSEVSNKMLDLVYIDMNNRWIKFEQDKGWQPCLGMIEVYDNMGSKKVHT